MKTNEGCDCNVQVQVGGGAGANWKRASKGWGGLVAGLMVLGRYKSRLIPPQVDRVAAGR